jgi:hypothetical protein
VDGVEEEQPIEAAGTQLLELHRLNLQCNSNESK